MAKEKKKDKKVKRFEKNTLFLGIICIASFFLTIGYAKVTNVNLYIEGSASVDIQKVVTISVVTYASNNNADIQNSTINMYYQSMLDSTIVLANDKDSTITYSITVVNLSNVEKKFVEVLYDDDFYDNPDITFELNGLTTDTVLQPGEDLTFTITFKYAEEKESYDNTILHSYLNFKFDNKSLIEEITYDGTCVFSGQGIDVVGDCTQGGHSDYIDTGLALFSEENYLRDFEISFNIDEIDASRFRSGQVDTVFSCLYESSPFPGIALRIQNSAWYLQVGNGTDNKKITINEDIESFKIKKVNGRVYYKINDGPFIYTTNINNLSNNFNDHLTLGVALNPDGTPKPERYLIATLSDVNVQLLEPNENMYEVMDQMILDFIGEDMVTAYEMTGSHTFDGTASTAVDTGVQLFSTDTYQDSFVVSLTINDLTIGNQVTQATLFNAKNEGSSKYPGLVLRRNGARFELAFKDGESLTTSVYIPASAERINIIKKGMSLYYQVDYDEIKPLGNSNNISSFPVANCFTVPATFGSNINGSGNYDRIIVGTLSNLKIMVPDN